MPYVIYDTETKEIQTVWNIGMPISGTAPSGSTLVEASLADVALVIGKQSNETAYYDTDNDCVYLADARTLDEKKAVLILQLEEDTKNFIEQKSTGKRYTQEKQASFNSIYLTNQLIVADAEATQGEKDAAQAKIDDILEVFAWIKSVLDYHFGINDDILEAEDEDELDAISWDFDSLESTDPELRLQEVM